MIRGFLFFIFLTLFLACDTVSNIKNPGQNYFLKYYGSEGNQMAKDLIVNSDGTFYILGNSTQTSTSITKVYLAKVDALGNVIKQITYGTFSMDAKDFELTSDGKLAVVANRQSAAQDVLLSRFSLDLNLIDSAVLSLSSNPQNSFANSLTELSDGGFIIEGYQGNTNTQSVEMHLRVDKTLKNYKLTVSTDWKDFNSQGTIAVGVKTIQHDPTTFYMFGYFNSNFLGSTGTVNKRFWTYPIPYNGSGVGNSDAPSFLSAGDPSDKIMTNAIKVKAGGYLMLGITNPSNYSLKASITNSYDTAFDFSSDGVFQDKILLSNLGQGPSPDSPYATAFSATSYNFILANTYTSGSSDMILLKVGNDLQSQWTNLDGTTRFVQYGGAGEDTPAAVAELPDGHIMILGTMQLGNPSNLFKIVLMKLNSQGQLQE